MTTGKSDTPEAFSLPHNDAEAAALAATLQATASVATPVALSSLPVEGLSALIDKMANASCLQGAAVAADPPLLGFLLRDRARADVASPRALRFFPWVWPDIFGASLTITMYRHDTDPALHARVFLPRSAALAQELLLEPRFIAVMFRDGTPRQAFNVQLPGGTGDHSFATQLARLKISTANNPDNDALFWASCQHWREHLQAPERLSLSWVHSYTRRAEPLFAALRSGEFNFEPDIIDKVPGVLRNIFKEPTPEGAIRAAVRIYSSVAEGNLQTVLDALGELSKQHSMLHQYADEILWLSFWTSGATDQGRRLPWWDNSTHKMQYIILDGHALQQLKALDDYWERLLIYNPLHIDWGQVVDGRSAPCKPSHLVRMFTELVNSDSSATVDVDTLLIDLTRETLQLPGPLTKQRVGDFVSHRAFWSGDDIATIATTAEEEFFVFVTAKDHGIQVDWPGFLLAGADEILENDAISDARIKKIENALRIPFVNAAHSLLTTEELRLFDIEAWEAAPLKMEIERIRTKQYPMTHWRNNSELRPSDLYVYLKSRFGEPNGAMSVLRRDASDKVFHWQWNIRIGDELLCILASGSGVVFRASTPKAVTRGQQWEIIKRLKASFSLHGRDMSKVRGSLESWTLLLNPYQRLVKMIETLEQELKAGSPPEPSVLTTEATKLEREAYLERLRTWSEGKKRVAAICFSIESYTPIMCEAFINLVLFALARPELRDDEVLYQSILRQGVDLRIRGLHMNCRGFSRAVDCSDSRYQRFGRMREKRNLLLHGNLDPKAMIIDRVFFDGNIPVFPNEESILHRRIRANSSLSDPISAGQAIDTAHAFVDLILAAMEPAVRSEIVFISGREEIGWREDTSRLGVLFGDVVGIAFDLPDGFVVEGVRHAASGPPSDLAAAAPPEPTGVPPSSDSLPASDLAGARLSDLAPDRLSDLADAPSSAPIAAPPFASTAAVQPEPAAVPASDFAAARPSGADEASLPGSGAASDDKKLR